MASGKSCSDEGRRAACRGGNVLVFYNGGRCRFFVSPCDRRGGGDRWSDRRELVRSPGADHAPGSAGPGFVAAGERMEMEERLRREERGEKDDENRNPSHHSAGADHSPEGPFIGRN